MHKTSSNTDFLNQSPFEIERDNDYADLKNLKRIEGRQKKSKKKKSSPREPKYYPPAQEVKVVKTYLLRSLFYLRLQSLCSFYLDLAEVISFYCDFSVREEHIKTAIRNIPAELSAFVLEKYSLTKDGKKVVGKDKEPLHLEVLRSGGIPVQGLRVPESHIMCKEKLRSTDLSKGAVNIEWWEDEDRFNYAVKFLGQEIMNKPCRHFAHAVPCIKRIIPEKMNVHDTENLFKEADMKRELYDGITDRVGDKLKKAITNITGPINKVVEEEAIKLGLPETLIEDLRIRIANETVKTTDLVTVKEVRKLS